MSWRVSSKIFFCALLSLSLSWDISQCDDAPVLQISDQTGEFFFVTPEGPIPWPLECAVQQSGNIITNLDCYGGIGNSGWTCGLEEWPENGFETPAGSGVNYLWGGRLLVSGIINDSIRLSSRYSGIPFRPAGGAPTVEPFDYVSDYSIRTLFDDTTYRSNYGNREPMFVEIANRSHVFYGNPFNKTIIYDLVMTNVGDSYIEDTYVGFSFDTDIGIKPDGYYHYWYDDLVGSIREQGIVYAIDNDGDPDGSSYTGISPTRCFAFKVLNSSFVPRDTCFNWWGVQYWETEVRFGPKQKDSTLCDFLLPEDGYPMYTDEFKCLMRLSGWDYDQVLARTITADDPVWTLPDQTLTREITKGLNNEFLFSIGPVDLPPDSSVRILYATFTGELIHVNASNFLNNIRAEYRPDEYVSNLNFDDLLTVADASDYLVDSLLDPLYPPIGLREVWQSSDSVVVQWDPWVYPEVEGYEIYLSEVSPELLPYPGLAAPWLEPPTLEHYASLGRTYKLALDDLEPNRIYYLNVAHRTSGGVGSANKAIYPVAEPHFEAPLIHNELAYSPTSEEVTISWEEISGEDIDYYKIYQVDTTADTANLYHPFYDRGGATVSGLIPKDSFCFDDGCYFYYSMAEHARVDSGVFNYSQFADEGKVFVVLGVNKSGFESHFSHPITVLHIDPPTSDIVVVTNSYPMFVSYESIASFYDSAFSTSGYSYDIFSVKDSITKYGSIDSIDWHDFAAYRMMIIDDNLPDEGLAYYQSRHEGLSRYMLSGGIVVYCGSFNGQGSTNIQTRMLVYHPRQSYIREFFPVDSIYFVGPGYYVLDDAPIEDTEIGAFKVEDGRGILPAITFDSLRYPFGSAHLPRFWSGTTIPGPVGFKAPTTAEAIYHYRTTIPGSSIMENRTAGIRFKTGNFENYLFGFHLWYMNPDEVRAMIATIMAPGNCCLAVGDIDHSGGEVEIDIIDATWLARFLYSDWQEPYCSAEADINADGSVDLVDLSILVDFIFRYGPPMPVCE